MNAKQSLGWVFVLTGTVFLLGGLVVMLFATIIPGLEGPSTAIPDPSLWVSLANSVMKFVIDLLNVEWTPMRVGVLLIIVGAAFDGSGAYLIVSGAAKPKRRSTRRR